MRIDFPNSPSLNQVFTDTASGKSWIWEGEKWISYTNTASNQSFILTGSITTHAGISIPAGWLLCNGGSYLRSDYPALYNVILTTYGLGSSTNSTTFNVPDLRNRFVGGIGTQAWSNTLNQKGGSPDAVVVSHRHSIAHGHTGSVDNGLNSGSHSHTIDHGHVSSGGPLVNHTHFGRFFTTGSGGTGINTYGYRNDGTLTPQSIEQLTSGSDGGHSHGISVVDLPETSFSAAESPTHTHSLNITGSDTPNSNIVGVSAVNANLPPYIVLNYIIKT